MKKNIFAVWTAAAMLSGAVAWGQGMAPVNPAFARWQREKAAKAVKGGEAPSAKPRGARSPAARGEAGGEEMDFGFVPTVLDMGYLANLNDNMTQGVGDALPSSFDLRESGAVTGVKDQGSWGNCWAFAALGSLESWVKKSEGTELDLSENHLANRHGWNSGFGGGGNAQMAEGYLLRWAGPVAESEDGYPRPGQSAAGTVLRHSQRVRWIPGRTGYLDNDGIKSALMSWGALQADYYHANGYYNAKKASYYFNGGTSFRLSNHSVLLVGWDDGYSRKNFSPEPPGDGAFIARNSWGSGWGDGGYFRISYYDESFAWGALYSFSSAEPVDNYDGVYQHDPLGMVGAIGYGGPTAWGANLFTATNASKVSAVGFYAMTPRTTYTLRVYKGCTAGQPTSGTLAVEQSGTVDTAGYATVPLSSPVAVASGQRFSVVLQLATPGYAYPLAAEYAVAGYSAAATAGSGESFLSPNGSTWNDFTKRVHSTANFCCKAYVKAATAAKTLSGISIGGVNSLDAGASATFTCTASYSDGSSKAVSPKWSISEGSAWASVDASGTVTAKATDEQRTATVKAAYSEGGVSATATWKLLVTVAAPGAPLDLMASEGTEESCVRLSWTASAGASSYAVYRGTKESSGKAGYLGTVTVTRYADTAAVPGVDYRYFVKAKNGSGSSAFSDGAWGWRALAAPTELAASDGSREDRVDVTWNRSEGASHYRVWRSGGDEDFEAISGWQTACQFADETADIGTVYTYAVTAALDADGTRESAFSVLDEGFRTGPKTLKSLEIGGPVSLGSGARGTYSCTAVYTDGTRVQVTPEWSLAGGTLAVSGANAVVTAPAASENTTATLKADYTDGVTRSASLTIMVTPAVPAAPTGLTVASADGNGITLKWSAVADASSYQLWRATADEESAVIASTTATRHTDATAVPGVAYTYRVAAANGAGAGAPCATGVTATRPIAAPTGVSASYGTFADKVLVAWRACEGAAFYRVWRAESAEGEKTAISEWQAELSFEDTSAEVGTVYYYSVQAAADAAGTAASAFGGSAVGLRKVAPKPVALSIIGPERVAAESTAAYTAKVKYENGSTQTVVPVWYLASGNGFASIGSDGLLTVGALTDDQTATIGARFTDGATVEATLEVALIAPIVKTATVSDVEAHARWPWNGWVDVDYNLETTPTGTVAKIILSGYDLDHKSALAATTLAGDGARGGTVEPGKRRISWNLGADYPGFHASQISVTLNAVVSEVVEPDNPKALLHRWSFNGDFVDSVGGQDAIYSGTSTYSWTANGKAVSLPGGQTGSSGICLGRGLVPSVDSPVTIEIWGTQREIQQWSRIFDWTASLESGWYGSWCIMAWTWAMSLDYDQVNIFDGDNDKFRRDDSLAPYSLGTEYHISMVLEPNKNGSGKTHAKFAKRDATTGTVLRSVEGYVADDWSTAILSTWELWLGRSSFNEDSDAAADYNEVRIWNKALTDKQLSRNARLGADVLPDGDEEDDPIPPFDGSLVDGLVAYWPFDGNAKDASGNDGTVNGATPTSDRNGKANAAYYFDGNDIIEVADNESLRSVTNAFTISTWLKYDQTCASGGVEWVPILSKGTTEWQFGMNLNETSQVGWRVSTFPPQGQWVHLVGTLDSSGLAITYLNGVQICTRQIDPGSANSQPLYIGADPPGLTEYLFGTLDDLAIWSRVLTSEEVARLYAGERPVAKYLVVDLSGGPSAESWPVEYLDGEPEGGFNTDEYKTTKLVLRRIEAGAFMMGSSNYPDNDPHQVTLSQPYYIGVFEVTQKQYELVMGSNPSSAQGEKRPVEQVTWNAVRGNNWPNTTTVDANSFMGRLQARTGLLFDLPTEAQWEYACRAGTTSEFNNGGNTTDDMDKVGRYVGNQSDGKGGYSQHTTVGSYLPNTWGLYDMHGNVWEWCLDWFGSLSGDMTDPVGAASGVYRVKRGGSWEHEASSCAAANRGPSGPSNPHVHDGFRVACPCGL